MARVDIAGGQVSSLDQALAAVFEASGTTPGSHTGFHEIRALPRIDGNPGWLIAGTARRGGVPHRFLALVGTYAGTNSYYVSLFQAPVAIYEAWGGPTFFLRVAGKSVPEILTPALVAKVRKTTPAQDVQIADMVVTQSVNVLLAQMQATVGIVASMQGLGRDIATRTDCIMTSGCVPGTDNQGRTIMTFPND